MLPFGHVSAGYLISQAYGGELKKTEVWLIMLSGVILDFDLFLPNLFGFPHGMHHYFPIHTPVGVIALTCLLGIILRKKVSGTTIGLMGVAMMSHLVLDDLSHWLYLLGLEGRARPQIFWLWPFDPRWRGEFEWVLNKRIAEGWGNIEILITYFFTLPRLFYLEIILTAIAVAVSIRKRYKLQKAKIGGRS